MPGDEELILQMIQELARYEELEHQVVADCQTLHHWIFEKGGAQVLFAMVNGQEVGFALYFYNFSTFLGRCGLYLEDLYIRPAHRHKGYGRALIGRLADQAVQQGLGRMEWWCLDTNTPAAGFYRSLGAKPMEEWITYRLQGDTLQAAAKAYKKTGQD